MGTQREIHLAEEWAGLGRAIMVIVRRPFLVILGTLICASLGIFLAASKAPVHRSEVSLQLADPREGDPLQERLEQPTGSVKVAEALPFLTSDSILSQVVRAPEPGNRLAGETPVHLGLTTWVEDQAASPLAAWMQRIAGHRSKNFRLLASARRTRESSATVLDAVFLDRYTVRLSSVGQTETFDLTENSVIHFAGLDIELEPVGLVDGRAWRIEVLSPDQAIARVRERLRVSSPNEGSGVVQIEVNDSDPARAAAIGAAVAQAFLTQDTRAIEERARTTADQVGERLAEQRRLLATAERKIAQIQASNPDVLRPDNSALLLGEARLGIELQLREARTLEAGLFEAHRRLQAGELAQASRLGSSLDDSRIQALLETIVRFEDQRMRVGSLERSGYADALQTEAVRARKERRQLEVEVARIESLAERFAAGDDAALGALGDNLSKQAATPTETLTQLFIADYSSTSQDLITLRATYTDEWWEVADAENRLASLRVHILSHLRTKTELIQADLHAAKAWEDALISSRDSRPKDVVAAADAALLDLWERVVSAFGARHEGAAAQRARLEDALREVLGRLIQLPEDQRRIALPQLERNNLVKGIGELTSIHATALLAEANATSNAKLLVPAANRGKRVGPRLGFGALIGLVLGALLTFGIATVLENGDDGRGHGGGMGTGLTLLGEIAAPANNSAGPALLFADTSLEAASQRATRGRIDLAFANAPLRHIGIRAWEPHAGASSIAVGLALAWAECAQRTLVIDAAGGGLTASLGLPVGDGWSAFLANPANLQTASISVGYSDLRILTGSNGDHLTSLSPDHLQMLATHFDRVVVDLPLAGDSKADAISQQLDGIILAHGARDLDLDQSLPAIHRMEQAGTHLIGMIRTAARRTSSTRSRSA